MIATLIHADWSIRPAGRWYASARRSGANWQVAAPRPVGDIAAFLGDALAATRDGAVLMGCDFPIGLPAAYGARTGLPNFLTALECFGHGAWADFYRAAETPEQIGLHRPFYPARNRPGQRRAQLAAGLGLADPGALMRAVERGIPGLRRAACPIFWTLGANQAGKAAMVGWQALLRPARAAGARLYPFDTPRALLPIEAGLVIAETYPADAYAALGAAFGAGESKTRASDRAARAPAIRAWAAACDVILEPGCVAALTRGFALQDGADDGFDALAGVLLLIAVLCGEIDQGDADPVWEGAILGRQG